jgi:IclR family KDG regulon transcriptional repressor
LANSLTSFEKGLEILTSFYSVRPELSAKDISELLNIPLSTTYRYLEILVGKGLLTKDLTTKRMVLGPTIFRFANAASSKSSLVNLALPHMEKLTLASGESVFLHVIHEFDAICIGKTEAKSGIRMSLPLGSCLPLHAGASAKVLLAYRDETFLKSLVMNKGLPILTENTVTSLGELKRQLAKIRRQGYAITDSEANPGATAIAAPLKGIKGKVIAGLTLGGPSERIHDAGIQVLLEMVIKTANEISQHLGYCQDWDATHSRPSSR